MKRPWAQWPELVAFGLFLSAFPALAEERPWETQPLVSDPRLLAKAAASATAGDHHDVVLLFEEGRYVFDREGRCDFTYRSVYRLQTEAGVRGWSTLSADWAPWNEERPQVQARVVTADGQAHPLDPATIAEISPAEEDSDVFTDRRRLRAPLPAVAVGAVVEQMIRTVDRAPLFAAGSQFRYQLGSIVPLRHTRVLVDAPDSLPLHHLLRGLDGLSVERQERDGRVLLRVEAGPLDPIPAFEPWMSSDRLRRPFFAFSTGASWAAVAAAYDRLIDTQIGRGPAPLPKPATRREEVAAQLVKQLHEEVRYTGVEFGEAAIVPRSPAEVLARKYGDCKDKATLLASRLRAEGIAAQVALLNTGPGEDVEPDLPGLGFFDHAIVVLSGTPMLWIDATDEFARVGELPLADQDRWALIAGPGTTALVRTPATTSAANVQRKTRQYTLVESGKGTLVETTRPSGSIERAYRSYYAHTDPKAVRKSQEEFAQSAHGAGSVVAARNSDPRDLDRPFELRIESAEVQRAESDGTRAVVTIPIAQLFARPEFLDTALSLGEFTTEGSRERGQRVTLRAGGTSSVWFVVWREGAYRVLAYAAELNALGEEAWRRGEAGDLDGSRQLLDWARDTFDPAPTEDPLAGPVFPRLWSKDGPRGLDAIRFAASSLFDSPPWLTRGIQALDVGRTAISDPQRRNDLDRALLMLLDRANRPLESLAVAERLHSAFPTSTAAWGARLGALSRLDRVAEMRRLCEERLKGLPDDPPALSSLAGIFSRLGQYDEAEKVYARLASSGHAGALELNNRAWNAVLRGQVSDAALDWARQSSKSGRPASFHTLATVYGEAGRIAEAQQVLVQSVGASADDTVRTDDWYVVGRLAEQCGLAEQARQAYSRVIEQPSTRLDATSVLAKRRLVGLDARPARKKS